MSRLFGEEASGEGLFVSRTNEYAPEGMFRLGASMDADAGAAWYLFQDG